LVADVAAGVQIIKAHRDSPLLPCASIAVSD
jgi:hypothetical protein